MKILKMDFPGAKTCDGQNCFDDAIEIEKKV